ncbi:MAG: PorT family protein, partial [Muribaculaceae bacterium]|nr:PorT family protein [Muribaculaceae bacterium]
PVQGWGTGFDLGVVADINIRDYLSIQPGAFFESRSNTYTFINTVPAAGSADNVYLMTQAGTFNSYALTIPIVGSMRFNITDDIRWSVDFGPYVSFMFGSKLKDKVNHNSIDNNGIPTSGVRFSQKVAPVDFGFKLGTGLQVLDHYYIGAHYMAGATGAWKDIKADGIKYSFGGRTKAWVFTLGYNF